MLSASYLADCSDDLVKLYSQLEEDIITDMARRLYKMGKSEASEWQMQIYKDSGGLQSDINQYLKKYDAQAQKKLEALFESTWNDAQQKDMSHVSAAKRYMTANQKQMLETMLQRNQSSGIVTGNTKTKEDAIHGGAVKTFSGIQRLTNTIAASAQSAFITKANQAYMKTMTGAFTYDQAIKDAVTELASEGVDTVDYTDSGKIIRRKIESAVRSNVMTGINKQASQQTLNNCEATGTDLVEVSAHLGARDVDVEGRPWANHARWQGKVYSLSGKKTYIDGDGNEQTAEDFYEVCHPDEPDGICGINCRHSYYPYFEGTKAEYSKGELDEFKEDKVKLNGVEMSRYQAEQKLRQAERTIRKYKRVAMAQNTAEIDSSAATRKMKDWQAVARDICQQTGIRRDYAREYVGSSAARGKVVQEELKSKGNNVVIDNKYDYEGTAEEKLRYRRHESKHFVNDDDHMALVTRGEPMDFKSADSGSVNPKYKDDKKIKDGYSDVCVSAAFVFEARMRGFDVEVLPRFNGNKLDKLAHNPSLGWFNDKEINPDYIYDTNATTTEKMMKFVDNTVKEGQRYTLEGFYDWSPNLGHLISVLRIKGELIYYDGLKGKVLESSEIMDYYEGMQKGDTKETAMQLLRVDNLHFNPKYANYIMEGVR